MLKNSFLSGHSETNTEQFEFFAQTLILTPLGDTVILIFAIRRTYRRMGASPNMSMWKVKSTLTISTNI